MNKHLIFMDIDGTLVDKDMQISAKDRNAIEKAIDQGARVYVATGRKYAAAKEVAAQLHPAVQVVASNGSVYEFQEQLFQTALSTPAIEDVYQKALANQVSLFFFGLEKTFYLNDLPVYFSKEDQARLVAGKESLFEKIDSLATLHRLADEIINGIIISETDFAILAKIRQELVTIPDLSVSSSHANNLELIPQGISKATAIAALQKKYQITKEQTITFGDGMNDVEMFAQAAYSVAMGNAANKVKAHARFQTLPNTESGIAHFLTKYEQGDFS